MCSERAAQQFNGREAKTATLYEFALFPSRCPLPVFAHVISAVMSLLVTTNAYMFKNSNHFLIFTLLLLVAFAQSSFAQTNPQIEAAEKLNKVGSDFFLERNYEKALEFFLKELPLRREAKDALGEAWALNQIGESYSSLRKWQDAFDYYSQALPLFRQVKNSHGEARTLHVTCSRKITPSGRRESTKMKMGDSSYEENIYGRTNRWDFERF